MKTCVFITGTNCVGKTTLVKAILEKHGGISSYEDKITYSNDGKVAFAGKYDGKYGGVDGLNSVKILESLTIKAFEKVDVFMAEGLKLHSFGLSLQKALFTAQYHIVVFLYAPLKELDARLKERSGTRISEAIAKDQIAIKNAFLKWQEVGVKTLFFDTSKVDIKTIEETIWHTIQVQDGVTR